VAEWFKAPVLKTGVGSRPPGVRIPPHPPDITKNALFLSKLLHELLALPTTCANESASSEPLRRISSWTIARQAMVHGAQVGQVLLRRAPPHLGIIDVTQIDDRIGFGPDLTSKDIVEDFEVGHIGLCLMHGRRTSVYQG
jgi:hypothetical protein